MSSVVLEVCELQLMDLQALAGQVALACNLIPERSASDRLKPDPLLPALLG